MKSNKVIIIITFFILVFLCLISLCIGDTVYSITESIQALLGQGSTEAVLVVQNIRLPRIIAGVCAGITLSLSGVFSTTALQNNLADSGILGVQSGASFAALLVMLVLPAYVMFLPIAAFVGGLVAFALVIMFSYNKRIIPGRIVLAGVAVNALFSALLGLITIFNSQELQSTISWLNGSLAGVSNEESRVILVFTTFSIIVTLLLIPILKLLRLDDNIVINLGKNPTILRVIACIFSVFLASISVAFIGIISFIGILGPQIAKYFVKNSMRAYVVQSMLCGAIVIVGADMFSRLVFAPMEVPVGIIVGIIAAPFFLMLLRRNNVSS